MTTRQTPDAVREAVAKALYNFRPGCGWKTVKGRPASYAIPWDEACEAHKADAYQEADAALAALDSRAGDAGEGWKLVPVEPTVAMREAATAVPIRSMIGTPSMVRVDYDEADAIWSAMLAATPAPAVDDVDIDSPAARLDMVRVALTGIIDNPASAVPLARAGLDFCDLTEAQRKEMRGDA